MNMRALLFIPAVLLLCGMTVSAKKVLQFDENQGIIWVEDGKKAAPDKTFEAPDLKKKKVIIEERTVKVREHVKTKPMTAGDYRDAGIKFYFNNDHNKALKYFTKAWEMKTDAVDYFWMGACYRKMDKNEDMARIFNEIMEKYPKSEVADDALFYLAVNAQKENDYQVAYDRYKEVVEFYPDGMSVIGKFNFREEAKKQLRAMKIDILSRLKLLGYADNNAPELLKEFQTDHDLEPTGKPEKKTVEILIALSDAKEGKLKDRVTANESQTAGRAIYYGILCFLLLFNILWGARNIRAMREEKNRLELLVRELQ
jgi:tetratricopeptide (TPR) repeat protein